MTKVHHFTNSLGKKHPQFILAIDAQYYDSDRVQLRTEDRSAFSEPINFFPHEFFCQNAQSYLAIREREYLDESGALATVVLQPSGEEVATYVTNAKGENKKGDPRYKQLLPYMIARQLQDDGTYLYFPYRRTKKIGESRLAGNGSLGYGGHIDLEDVVSANSVIDLTATIKKSSLREAIEEFTAYDGEIILNRDTYDQYISFGDLFIVDNSNDVGELHLGIIMYFDVPQGYTLEATEDELAALSPMTAQEMLTDATFNPENWTRLYLEHIAECEGQGDVFEVDEYGLEKEYVDEESAEDLPEPEDGVIGIDHGGEKVGEVDTKILDNLRAVTEVGEQMAAVRVPPRDVISTIPEGYTNNIDWNNTLTGSPANAINLDMDELRRTSAVTNAVNKTE